MKQLLFTLVLFAVCLGHGIAQEKYAIHGIVVCSDNLPVKNVSVTSDNNDFVGCTDSLGRFEYVTDTLPITIYFKYIGCITKSLYVDKYNYKSLQSVRMDEEVIIDFCDERGGIKVPVAELERYGKYEDILVGSVYCSDDSLPLVGTRISALTKKGEIEYSVLADMNGKFYLLLKQLPTIVEISYIGCETIKIKITKRNITKQHEFYMQEDKKVIHCE